MIKVALSIPVHEQSSVVENQLHNIQKFVPNSVVILHVSGDSPSSFSNEITSIAKKMDGFVFINPTKYKTHAENEAGNVTGLSTVHASNFKYLNSVTDFDVFALDTSNDMFVRGGIDALFETYSCGFHVSMSDPARYAYQQVVTDISKYVKVKTMEKGSQEGSFYPKEVFSEVSDIIFKMGGLIKAEEMYLPSLAFNLFPELYDANSGSHYVYHNPAHYAVERHDIHQVQYGHYGQRFAVKRVPRNMDDPTRIYINKITQVEL